ncbi:MAG: hypothetical protein ACRDRD_17440, partial [Pseudonocardiaceae bacterium]
MMANRDQSKSAPLLDTRKLGVAAISAAAGFGGLAAAAPGTALAGTDNYCNRHTGSYCTYASYHKLSNNSTQVSGNHH